tara:strand:+ start:216 stop:590 length:375 start_codon:yes stop_codon:yes gene_type:complete
MRKIKFIFYLLNIILIIFYLYPGSIFGCIIFNDCGIQPQLTPDFIVSSNHVYVYLVLSITGLISYPNEMKKKIIIYLFFNSIFLEILHIFIPNRGFEYADLFGNIFGVLLSIIIMKIYYSLRFK